jgi:hypothetical protein
MGMARVTQEDIKKFNELYYKYKTYAEVARQTGFSAGTVSKYVDKNYVPIDDTKKKTFSGEINDSNFDILAAVDAWGSLLSLSPEELTELNDLWNEIAI